MKSDELVIARRLSDSVTSSNSKLEVELSNSIDELLKIIKRTGKVVEAARQVMKQEKLLDIGYDVLDGLKIALKELDGEK